MNTIKYIKWLEIRADHSYFPESACDVLSFSPLPQTARMMRNYNLKGVQYKNTFSLHCGYNADNGSFDAGLQLKGIDDLYFQLICSDHNFLNYTDIPLPNNEAQLLFLSNRADQSNDRVLQLGQFVSAAEQVINKKPHFTIDLPAQESNFLNIKNIAGEDVLTQTLNGLQNKTYNIDMSSYGTGYYSLSVNGNATADYFVSDAQLAGNCVGILHLAASDLLAAPTPPPILLVGSFNSRSTFWKYSVIVAPDRQINIIQMSIENLSGIEYGDPVRETVVGGAMATAYTSTEPVPLKKVSVSNQTLKISYSNIFSDRNGELNIKLPDPDISSLQINKTNSSLISTKLIYV